MSKLKDIRIKKNLSQNDLVRLSRVSRSVITKYESGEKDIRKANVTTLLKLAAILRCRVEDLVEGSEDIMEEGLRALYREWRQAGEDGEVNFTWDCGEEAAREDFSNYAGLEEEINFNEMLELERAYK